MGRTTIYRCDGRHGWCRSADTDLPPGSDYCCWCGATRTPDERAASDAKRKLIDRVTSRPACRLVLYALAGLFLFVGEGGLAAAPIACAALFSVFEIAEGA